MFRTFPEYFSACWQSYPSGAAVQLLEWYVVYDHTVPLEMSLLQAWKMNDASNIAGAACAGAAKEASRIATAKKMDRSVRNMASISSPRVVRPTCSSQQLPRRA